nr:hypothetical protein [Tanacetum cinerariifolium]
MAKNANPLALVAATQQYPDPYYQAPKPHRSLAQPSKQSSSTRSKATTKYKCKEIAKPNTPPSESTSKEDSDPEEAPRDKDMQKTWHSLQSASKRSMETNTQETDKNQANNDKTKAQNGKDQKNEVNRSWKTKVKTFGQQKSTLKVK